MLTPLASSFGQGKTTAHALRTLPWCLESCGKPTLSQDDGGDLTPIICLIPGPRTSVTEEIVGMRISAGGQGPNDPNAGAQQPLRAVARQIEVVPVMRALT